MEAKLKAKELVEKFYSQVGSGITYSLAKQCALIAVEEIMILMNQILDAFESESDGYWEQVKNEIQQL